ncbi:MAG: hypothetical protein IJ560_04590 [Alphaproteobacteria bacterium]|nr:hypothetical protein [Alphaproteobacteria bacterium]
MNMPKFLLRCSLIAFAPIAANAAGTYYTGNYQSPQNRYTQKNYTTTQGTVYTQGTTYRSGYIGNASQNGSDNKQIAQQKRHTTQSAPTETKSGFSLDAGISHQFAEWRMEMDQAGSLLHYDNIGWNVFDAGGKYVFDIGNTQMQINAGFLYGIQSGESTMVDDDISNGGYWYAGYDGQNSLGETLSVDVYGRAMSIGKSSGGDMMGFNVGFGLTDFFKWGNARITPSIGYRYLKYKLETKENYGLSVTTSNSGYTCYSNNGGDEVQCDPSLLFFATDSNGDVTAVSLGGRANVDVDGDGYADVSGILIPTGVDYVNLLDSFYYQQSGTSHSYEVEWSGPYIALDAVYDINQNNSVTGHVELGLPAYTSTGDQPYRIDWEHPKSVKDSAGMFSGLHLGLGANYMTAVTDSVMLTIGFTYDYYSISGADSETYMNASYYQDRYDALKNAYADAGYTEAQMLEMDETAAGIAQLKSTCPGWVCSDDGEIDSFYKSMGIRVGFNAKF